MRGVQGKTPCHRRDGGMMHSCMLHARNPSPRWLAPSLCATWRGRPARAGVVRPATPPAAANRPHHCGCLRHRVGAVRTLRTVFAGAGGLARALAGLAPSRGRPPPLARRARTAFSPMASNCRKRRPPSPELPSPGGDGIRRCRSPCLSTTPRPPPTSIIVCTCRLCLCSALVWAGTHPPLNPLNPRPGKGS